MRFSSATRFSRVLVLAMLLGSLTVVSGCRSGGGAPPPSEGSAAPAQEAAPAKGVAPPADHRMAKLQANMAPWQVEEIMGAPTGQSRYPTGKSFAPFQFSNDSGWRMEYKYKGEGRVVFATPRWGGSAKVVRIDYDPSEDGN